MRPRTFLALTLLAAALTAAPALGGTFVAGGTLVARGFGSISFNGITANGVDDGAMVCASDGSAGVGGLCIPASPGANAVVVSNELGSTQVAFQVCVDHNQDGFCSFGNSTAGCSDDLYFSHDDFGLWHNPLGGPGVLAQTLDCFGQPWHGAQAHWLVFICNGVHQAIAYGQSAHAHPTNEGLGFATNIPNWDAGGIELGFCQPNDSISAKAYLMV